MHSFCPLWSCRLLEIALYSVGDGLLRSIAREELVVQMGDTCEPGGFDHHCMLPEFFVLLVALSYDFLFVFCDRKKARKKRGANLGGKREKFCGVQPTFQSNNISFTRWPGIRATESWK